MSGEACESIILEALLTLIRLETVVDWNAAIDPPGEKKSL